MQEYAFRNNKNITVLCMALQNYIRVRYYFSTSVHGIETIENYNPLVDLWHSAQRVQSLHGYLPVNITIGFEERPFISYNSLGGIVFII